LTPTPPNRPRRLGRWLLVAGALAALAAGLAAWRWAAGSTPAPPAVDLTGVDPEVADAVTAATRAVRGSPRSAAAWGQLGMVLMAHDFPAAADACLGRAEALDPRDPRWPYLRGQVLALTDPAAALAAWRRAAAGAGDVTPPLRLGEALLQQGQPAEAEEQFRRVLGQEPDNPYARLGLGRAAMARGALADSREQLDGAAANPLTAKAAHGLLAAVAQREGDVPAVARELAAERGLPDDPARVDPYLEDVGHVQTGRRARLERGRQLLTQGRVRDAVAWLRETAELYPEDGGAWLWLGRALVQGDDLAGADEALARALRADPGLVEAHFYAGVVRFGQGKFREAADAFREAAERKPDYALAHYNRGRCLLRLMDDDGALAAFRDAVAAKPPFEEAHVALAEVLARKGNKAEAREHLRQATGLDPNDEKARRLLEELEK
jgi:tetratricopeptide (TPR) repeat protein